MPWVLNPPCHVVWSQICSTALKSVLSLSIGVGSIARIFCHEALLTAKGRCVQGKRVALSGSGNVATYAVEKLLELGAIPVTMSDSTGYVYYKVAAAPRPHPGRAGQKR